MIKDGGTEEIADVAEKLMTTCAVQCSRIKPYTFKDRYKRGCKPGSIKTRAFQGIMQLLQQDKMPIPQSNQHLEIDEHA